MLVIRIERGEEEGMGREEEPFHFKAFPCSLERRKEKIKSMSKTNKQTKKKKKKKKRN